MTELEVLTKFFAGLGGNRIPTDLRVCEYHDYCPVREVLEKQLCLINDNTDCQTYRFFRRYEIKLFKEKEE